VFDENQIFRIDHYLGKETVQNLIALRFANTLFEPLWNNLTIDHVQITVAETGRAWATAGPTTTSTGACATCCRTTCCSCSAWWPWSPPSDMEPDSVRNEKVKVLRSLRRFTRADAAERSVRGQYTPGVVGGKSAEGYEAERGQKSGTETFVALRADIDNWRWAGVPFFLRTGKRMPEKRTQISAAVQAGAALDLRPQLHPGPDRQPPGHRPAAGRGHQAHPDEQGPGPEQGRHAPAVACRCRSRCCAPTRARAAAAASPTSGCCWT
jgi:glucose-6-phosphate 1-dehydrogenase